MLVGYKFQFITLAGFHALNTSMVELSKAYKEKGMAGFSQLQQGEFALQEHGFKAVKHQSFVGRVGSCHEPEVLLYSFE